MTDQQKAADILATAWQQGLDEGIGTTTLASTALTLALSSLVKETDRETAIRITKRLIGAVENGKFG